MINGGKCSKYLKLFLGVLIAMLINTGVEAKVLACKIEIYTQGQFNNLTDTILKDIAKGYTYINIDLKAKSLYYKDNHIFLNNIDRKDITIKIKGEGTRIVSSLKEYACNSNSTCPYNGSITTNTCFLSETMSPIAFYGKFKALQNLVEIVDSTKKLCRIKADYKGTADGMTIQTTASFKSYFNKVSYTKNGYIYFIDASLQRRKYDKGAYYSINHDYIFGGKFPRYRIFNGEDRNLLYCRNNKLYFPATIKKVYECQSGTFAKMTNCNFKSFSISGCDFVGGKKSGSFLYFNKFNTDSISISNCTFKYIKNDILSIIATKNVKFSNNRVEHCWGNAIYSDNDSPNTTIINNQIGYIGEQMLQQHTITCQGENYLISSNTIYDFSYSAICVGVHYRQKMKNPCSGIIENNDIYYTKDYIEALPENTLMDSGAIYITTQNTKTEVCYNYIHDYCGMAENRGIYCDDGAMNLVIKGNVIKNISNSYTIDARRTPLIDTYVRNCNSNNVIENNVLYGPYRFQARQQSNCKTSCNFIVGNTTAKKCILSNIVCLQKDKTSVNITLNEKDIKSQINSLVKTLGN